jgi:hypothetical protein
MENNCYKIKDKNLSCLIRALRVVIQPNDPPRNSQPAICEPVGYQFCGSPYMEPTVFALIKTVSHLEKLSFASSNHLNLV